MTTRPAPVHGRPLDAQVTDLVTALAAGEQHTSSSADGRAIQRAPEAAEYRATHRSTRTEIPA
ncbi:hypothetical protein SAMN04515665_107116 [Blastococcus sp. DSM 46786]|uniref:hypothetical protein n=1 Tax=Blastococcus sp. DSM 46786 TaxID=1798227 RepID=UPI0008AD24D3|nr:hypothetical protein [Blastococcus sp. DSM 46786]SEL02015.1 hypothetical protein SAMN04515665_107116 [Blastococcus sp. DSM 46786]